MVQSLDQLVLGPFVFTDFSPPEQMAAGGSQRIVKHEILGGYRVIDVLGASPDDRSWSGFWFDEDALSNALSLDALRVAGNPLPLSWGAESRTVVISKFTYSVEKFNYIHYQITCVVADNLEVFGGLDASADLTIGDDLLSAVSTITSNASDFLGGLF